MGRVLWRSLKCIGTRRAHRLLILYSCRRIDIRQDPPSRKELDKAISLLQRNKAPGIDIIFPELLKDGGNNIRKWLLRICKPIWHKESTPSEWGKGIILPLPKKGDLSYCNNNRGITLFDIADNVAESERSVGLRNERKPSRLQKRSFLCRSDF